MTQKILYIGQLNDSSGYGNAARNYIKCFDQFLADYKDKVDFKIFGFNFENKDATTPEEKLMLSKYEIRRGDIEKYVDANTKIIYHLIPEIFSNEYWPNVVAKTTKENTYSSIAWEPDSLPKHWVDLYNQRVGKFIVYCDFTKQCFLKHGFDESLVHLIPHPIFDIEENDPSTLNRDKFNIFSMSQWNNRKGWDILIPAVCHEFFNNDDVELTIKTFRNENIGGNPIQEKEFVINEVKNYKNSISHYNQTSKVKINLISGIVEKSLISDLFKQSSVYCLPTRCDSFGLTMGEAVIAKRTAIVPSLGGHRDYFSDDNPFLVKSCMKPSTLQGKFFSTLDMNLVETDYNDLRKKLRKAYEMWKEDPDLLAAQAQANYDYATSEVINNKRIFDKFLNAIGVAA